MSNKSSNEAVEVVHQFLDSYLKGHTAQETRRAGVPYRYISDKMQDELSDLDRASRFPEIDATLDERDRIDGLIGPDEPGSRPPSRKYMSKEARRFSRRLRQNVVDHRCDQMSLSAHLSSAVMRDYQSDDGGQLDTWPDYLQVDRMMSEWEWGITMKGQQGFAVWFIGYPGSGKTTLATALYLRLFGDPYNTPLMLVDNDLQRNRDIILAPAQGHFYTIGGVEGKPDFCPASRLQRMKQRAGMIGSRSNGGIVVGASFCPLPEQRRMLANACRGRFVLVHVATPIEECKVRREKEGYYTDPEKDPGIADFVPPTLADGDVPPDLTIDTASEPLWKSVVRVLRVLQERGWMGVPE